ncbi:MAG: hypothetical protein HUU16_20230 [Candidatus Omnitrophica bacterium]|nr:hypothetical protein [Candidatus Omnitrophota bacterium]
MHLGSDDFKKQLRQYIEFRGIDIVLHLKNGTTIELDKNRQIEGDVVIKNGREGIVASVHIDDVLKADFFAA